jgi:Ca2+:H+ antiporter
MISKKEGINKIFYWMLLFIPLSLYFSIFSKNETLLFITSVLALIPLARIIGYSTKEIVLQTNPTWGGLANATFGNIIELIIAIIALSKGLLVVVQASIVGSIIGNILLLIGLSAFFGGIRYKYQKFNKYSVGVSSTLLIIAVTGLVIPSVFSITSHASAEQVKILNYAVALVMALVYFAGLIFSFITHKHIFDASDEIKATHEKPVWDLRRSFIVLIFSTILVAFESEFLVRGIESATMSLGLTQTFIGVVIIAIVTNVAEKANAIHFARENKIDVSLEIGLSSAIQIALFVVPVLVFISGIFNYGFSLVFSTFELVSIFFSVMIINYLSSDGECNWLEGAQLISVYLIIVIAFFFV